VCFLFVDSYNNTGTYGTPALTDSEAKTLFNSDMGDKLNIHLNIVAGHTHLNAFGKLDYTGNIGGSEIELGTVVVKERCVASALFL